MRPRFPGRVRLSTLILHAPAQDSVSAAPTTPLLAGRSVVASGSARLISRRRGRNSQTDSHSPSEPGFRLMRCHTDRGLRLAAGPYRWEFEVETNVRIDRIRCWKGVGPTCLEKSSAICRGCSPLRGRDRVRHSRRRASFFRTNRELVPFDLRFRSIQMTNPFPH